MMGVFENALINKNIYLDTNLKDVLNSAENTSKLTEYIIDAIYILAIIVVAIAFFTLVAYLLKYVKGKKDPYYEKDDDDFLD